jgi:serine/threonine protein kinase
MFHIASDHDKPFIPAHLSPEAHDFLYKCFDKNPNTRPTAQKLLEHPFVTDTKIQSELTSRPSDNAISGPGSSTIGSEDGLSWSSDESEPEDLSTYNPNRWPLTIKEMAFAIQWQKLVRKRHGKTAWFQLLHRWIARVRYRISLRENDISFWTSRSISARSNTIYDHISSVFTTKRSEASIGQSTSSKESNSSRESSSYEYIEPSDETSFSNDGANDSYSSSDDAEYSSSGSDDSSHEIDNHNSSHETDVIIFGTVRALADYKSTAANELSMREGDMIEILDVSSSGWWKARHVHKVRQIGWIPCTYVEWLQRTIDVTFKAVVKVPYSAQTSNELSLKKEEVVTVKRCDSRGHGIWFQGTKKSGENGWFPMECVQRV